MLSRERRLKKTEFETVFAQGRQFRHPLMALRCYQRPAEADVLQLRAAFAVPKKLGKATRRNLWRRRLRHWFYEILKQATPALESETAARENFSKLNRCDLIFMLTAQGEEASPQAVREAMEKLWGKALHHLGRNEPFCI